MAYITHITFRNFSASFIELDRRGRMVFLQTKAVGALALVKNIWSKFSALGIGHDDGIFACSKCAINLVNLGWDRASG